MSSAGIFYGGISGLQVPIPKRDFPPEFTDKSRLNFYASLFNSIEINSSFYKLPLAKTLAKWALDVPENFKFTYKLWRDITHNKDLLFKPEDVDRFMQVINHADNKKGCLLVQFPPSITVACRGQLEYLLSVIRNIDPNEEWKLAVEFRHRSWYDDGVYELLQKYKASFVIQDMPASVSPLITLADDVVYLRFHGPNGGYRGSYADDFLYEYAQYTKEWLAEGKDVYAYFNNTMGDAINNLITLKSFLEPEEL
ncbi:DUF72 domain-containing protein [Mucilaginibacter sp. X5P1]|uniref:DUF72 domain-containing protein n=1 Tax=Mucilaginibacter sp. X5P1 TaxID=2723088 RepID=UPI0016092FFE|nr:DUF72 domain-containing protein [Mucilaginibacter sp. X5P1]MBB6137870.1 uncharacterized protein YecE (DUF72 family) [Mucilaginibacter sp. X5P1]